jgi:ferritin-like metal-binding protein YciE
MAQTSSTARSARDRKAKEASGKGQNNSSARQGGRQNSNQRNETRQSTTRPNTRQRSGQQGSGRQQAGQQRTAAVASGQGSNMAKGSAQGESLLEKFFLDQLKDIYYAEQKIAQSLPKMQQAATTDELKEAFDDHLHQTQRHIKRLEKVFETLGKKAEGKKCEAIEGITKEAESIIQETQEGSLTRDAALIIAAQKVEHYEIATYGGLVQLAITMDLHDAADLLDKTLIEEEDTDRLLTQIAENEINLGAEHEGNKYSWDRGEQESNNRRAEHETEDATATH